MRTVRSCGLNIHGVEVLSSTRVGRPVGVAFLQEGVAAFDRLVGHVSQAGGLTCEDLLAHETVVEEVEGELQHPLGVGRLAEDLLGHGQRRGLKLFVVDDLVDGAHVCHVLGRVGAAEEEDLAGLLLADHLRQVGGPVAAS